MAFLRLRGIDALWRVIEFQSWASAAVLASEPKPYTSPAKPVLQQKKNKGKRAFFLIRSSMTN